MVSQNDKPLQTIQIRFFPNEKPLIKQLQGMTKHLPGVPKGCLLKAFEYLKTSKKDTGIETLVQTDIFLAKHFFQASWRFLGTWCPPKAVASGELSVVNSVGNDKI